MLACQAAWWLGLPLALAYLFWRSRKDAGGAVPPFHKELLRGVSSYGFEFLAAHPDLDTIYATGADRIIAVSDDPVANAMRADYTDIHNLAEGAGAAPLAGPMQERIRMQGKKVGVILGGGNIDTGWFAKVLMGQTPTL
ncbi:MAG: hypothetical protein L3J30_13780 [Marinosulfonomonas sp.]|nr:hypothetical protein [Marinosulfonomonas sp.]